MPTLETIDLAALDAARGGLARATSSSANSMLLQQMTMISESIRDAARQQQQSANPMMFAMLAIALANRA